MTVIVTNNAEITVPKSIRRRAGIKPGDRLEFTVSGGVIKIAPKLSPDELEDAREIRDPKVRAAIRASSREFAAGKVRPAGAFMAERASRAGKRG